MNEKINSRISVQPETIKIKIDEFCQFMRDVVEKKGDQCFVSMGEILGEITEEYYELIIAKHQSSREDFCQELKDIAVLCIFGLASMDNMRD